MITRKNLVHFLRRLHCIELADYIRYVYEAIRIAPTLARFKRENPDYPIPPLSLSYDAYGTLLPEIHQDDGYSKSFCDVFSRYVENQDGSKILEWGCGPGRIIRHVPEILANKNVSAYGSDYNERTVNWCRNNLPGISFHKNNPPPLCHLIIPILILFMCHQFSLNCQKKIAWLG